MKLNTTEIFKVETKVSTDRSLVDFSYGSIILSFVILAVGYDSFRLELTKDNWPFVTKLFWGNGND